MIITLKNKKWDEELEILPLQNLLEVDIQGYWYVI